MSNNWNRLCEKVEKNYSEKEEKIQKVFEQIFAVLFGYDPLEEEIDSHRVLHIGSTDRVIPDIIIRDSSKNKDLFIIELKQLNLRYDVKYEKQLFSYMRLLSLNVGVLICDAIYVYVLDNDKALSAKIEILAENKKGEEFIDIFSKGNFSTERIEKFVSAEYEFDENVKKVKDALKKLDVNDLIKFYFISDYEENEIDEALKDFDVVLKEKNTDLPSIGNNPTPPPTSPRPLTPDTKMDYSKYYFEGQLYGKNKLVLAVVSAYVRNNPGVTYLTLKTIFHDNLQGSTGVIATPSEARAKRKDPEKRFFTHFPVTLVDGPIWVCTQWGIGNIDKFIKKADALGYKITKA